MINRLRFVRWLREVYHLQFLSVTIIILILTIFFPTMLSIMFGQKVGKFQRLEGFELAITGLALMIGGIRCSGYHPATMPEYREWLSSTPWRPGKKLPQGPLWFVLQDVIVIGCLAGLVRMQLGQTAMIEFVRHVLVGYSVASAIPLSMLKNRMGYLVGAGLGMVALLWFEPIPSLIAAGATYLISWLGVWLTLKTFPWTELKQVEQAMSQAQKASGNQSPGVSTAQLGWPFDALGPMLPPKMHLIDSFFTAALLAWYYYIVTHHSIRGNPGNEIYLMMTWAGIGHMTLCSGRLIRYLSGKNPPITFWGRIANYYWLIFRYDRAWMGPMLTFALGICLIYLIPKVSLRTGAPHDTLLGLVVFVNLFLVFVLPPSYRVWHLTGAFRLSHSKIGEFVQTK